MASEINSAFFQICIFVAVGILFGIALMLLSIFVQKIFSVGKTRIIKSKEYECGVKNLQNSSVQFDVKYYIFALMFLVFDVEFVFLIPWTVSFIKTNQQTSLFLIEAFVFILILFVGWYFGLKEKVFQISK